jgi:hypothetical protein
MRLTRGCNVEILQGFLLELKKSPAWNVSRFSNGRLSLSSCHTCSARVTTCTVQHLRVRHTIEPCFAKMEYSFSANELLACQQEMQILRLASPDRRPDGGKQETDSYCPRLVVIAVHGNVGRRTNGARAGTRVLPLRRCMHAKPLTDEHTM